MTDMSKRTVFNIAVILFALLGLPFLIAIFNVARDQGFDFETRPDRTACLRDEGEWHPDGPLGLIPNLPAGECMYSQSEKSQ
ncbi:hypothetical protein D2T29_12400 [Sinirhodobacter populi]|uniref:Uncharacterized protein n=1 Tax=Paenirhodobacter populi TaxID=2306993 RepID=A0A443KCK4_9RHOB|nr:hypothetical protein [Sinirhodobacter populi]RWR30465.1 hypothetical protein D2T29_12400 [Sinirhodobacter populi]